MGFDLLQRVYRFGALCVPTVAAVSGVFGLFLLAGAVSGYRNGSVAGTILLAGFGVLVLLIPTLVAVGGVVYFRSPKPRTTAEEETTNRLPAAGQRSMAANRKRYAR